MCVCFFTARLRKDLAPYRIGKHSHPQNRAKIRQQYPPNTMLGIFGVFLPYFLVRAFSYSVGANLFFTATLCTLTLWEDEMMRGQVFAVWILAAKLPNSDLNFAVSITWWTFRIFFIFFLLVGGTGEAEAPEGGGRDDFV